MKINVCAKTIEAYGSHARFAPDEHIQLLLSEHRARDAQAWPYAEWELAASSINWFDGEKRISLAYVKQHMPRAMLLTLRFPVDQNPHAIQADVDRLLEAERKYNESTNLYRDLETYLRTLMNKYGIGPTILLDEDMGGATPRSMCAEWEEREWPDKQENVRSKQ